MPLSAPRPPFNDFWASVCVALREPLQIEGDDDVFVGYYKTLGVRCESNEVQRLLSEAVEDGDIRWDLSDVDRVDVAKGLDPDTEMLSKPVEGEGTWYQSGRAFFREWDDAE